MEKLKQGRRDFGLSDLSRKKQRKEEQAKGMSSPIGM